MIFSRKNAGKWVASKDGKAVAASAKLATLIKRVEKRDDYRSMQFDLVPRQSYFAGCAI